MLANELVTSLHYYRRYVHFHVAVKLISTTSEEGIVTNGQL